MKRREVVAEALRLVDVAQGTSNANVDNQRPHGCGEDSSDENVNDVAKRPEGFEEAGKGPGDQIPKDAPVLANDRVRYKRDE